MPPRKLRSAAITEGVERAPNRAMLRAVGFTDADFGKPIVGIASGYSTITPCNAGLDILARRAEAAVRAGGAMPQLFGTITVSDGISMGTEGMKYSLVSREVIADSIETACGAQSMDAVVAVGGCDKNMPGAMIAIARMNIPAIFVYGGTIKPGHYQGRDLTVVSAFEAVGQFSAGRMGDYTITKDPTRDAGLRVLMGPFSVYNKDNVEAAEAQKLGLTSGDAYTAELKWGDEQERPGVPEDVVKAIVAELDKSAT